MYMSTRERAKADSEMFVSPSMAVAALEARGCSVEVIVEEEGLDINVGKSAVKVFRIQRASCS